MRWLACLLGLLALGTGCVLEDKPVDPVDGGNDAGNDAGLCGGCTDDPTKPVCNENLECVQCTVDDYTYCTERSLVCDTESSTCVQCVGNADCTAPDAARCDAHECKPCDDAAQCSNVDDLPVGTNACDDGLCVDCTPETELDTCANHKSCNPDTKACTDTTVGSLSTCEACVADSECGDNGAPSTAHRCVPMYYPPPQTRFPDEHTGFCLKIFSIGGCEQPYAIRMSNRESLSDDTAETYCGISETLTTCPAVRALDRNQGCPGSTNDECPEGGICRDIDGLPTRCTYKCDADQQCLPIGSNPDNPNPGSSCGSDDDAYCGG